MRTSGKPPGLERYWADLGKILGSPNPILGAGFVNYVEFTVGCLERLFMLFKNTRHPNLSKT